MAFSPCGSWHFSYLPTQGLKDIIFLSNRLNVAIDILITQASMQWCHSGTIIVHFLPLEQTNPMPVYHMLRCSFFQFSPLSHHFLDLWTKQQVKYAVKTANKRKIKWDLHQIETMTLTTSNLFMYETLFWFQMFTGTPSLHKHLHVHIEHTRKYLYCKQHTSIKRFINKPVI